MTPDRYLMASPVMHAPWVAPFARYSVVTRHLLDDELALRSLTEHTTERLNDQCARDLRTQLSIPTVMIYEGSADLFTRNQAMVLAEVVTLNRAEPMQWPDFVPFPRLAAAQDKARRLRRRARRLVRRP